MLRHNTLSILFLLLLAPHLHAQEASDTVGKQGIERLLHDVRYDVEVQGSLSHGKTPLWLNANKYGLSSLEEQNGYARAAIERPLSADSSRRWGLGYGVDVAVPVNYTSNVVVQQAYAEARWLKGVLTVGSKQWPMEWKNNALSSGSQTLGINARPVPQVRLALQDYWIPGFLNGWLRLKGHVAYGKMTDDNWQHEFTSRQSKYADNVLYHSKACYIKIGNEERFLPLSLELGVEMGALFGGTSYTRDASTGEMTPMECQGGLKGAWQVLIPAGKDPEETVYRNIAGDELGSWLVRINYDSELWSFHLYGDKFFEDHSGLFFIDYDGFGEGEEWQKYKKFRILLYDLKDMMLGAELNLHYGTWLRNVVFEYLYTKYQSGPIYHDHTYYISDHVAGQDNFYNHYIYTGWQHWGQVIGNPLYLSPIYNDNGAIEVMDNRFIAFHLGFDGQPTSRLGYRVLATWQKGYGTYAAPYTKPRENISFLTECTYKLPKGWTVRGAYAMDFGRLLGDNHGFQLTISKSGWLSH